MTLPATRETRWWTASTPRTHERHAEAEILIRLRAVKSKLPDNIPPPCCIAPCGGSWAANNRCCARLKNSAARRDAQKVERRESAGVSITAGPALEKCDRGYICAGFRALRRGWRKLEAEVKGKLHAGGGLSGPSPERHLHFIKSCGGDGLHLNAGGSVGRLETSPELTVGLGSGWGCASINTSSSTAAAAAASLTFSLPQIPLTLESQCRLPPPAHGVLAGAAPPLIFTLRACPSLRLMSQHSLRSKPFQRDSWEAATASAAAALRNGSHHQLPA